MIEKQGAEKGWNRHCQAEADADYNIPDLSSICFTMPHFHKKAGDRLWESISGAGRRQICTHINAFSPTLQSKVQHRGSFVHGKGCFLGTEGGKMLHSPSEPPVLGAWSWRRQRCWPCQCTQQFLQGKALSESNCCCCLT